MVKGGDHSGAVCLAEEKSGIAETYQPGEHEGGHGESVTKVLEMAVICCEWLLLVKLYHPW